MLSALRPGAARPGLLRPHRGHQAIGVPAAVPRSGDGAGEQLRPKPRPPPAPPEQPTEIASASKDRLPAAKQQVGGCALKEQLDKARSPEQVVQLVQHAGERCDDVDLTTAMNRLVKLPERDASLSSRCRAAFQQLAQIALGQQLDPWAVTQFMWAAGKLWEGVAVNQPFGSQQAAWQQRMTAAFGDRSCKPQSVSNGLWAASKLGWQLEGSLAEAAEAALERLAARMDSQAVSNTLWAFANAGWLLGSRAAAHLLQQLELLLPQANAQDVSNSMWAMSKLGLPLSNDLKAAFAQALQRTIPVAKSQELANSLLACGILGWSPGRPVLAAAAAAMQRLLANEPGRAAQAVNNFLWGLAELQEQLAIRLQDELPALLATAADWADSRWAQLSALDVIDLCYNLACLGHRPSEAWICSASERCLERIAANEAAGVGFANFIWACSTWGHRLQGSELEQLVPAAVDNMCATWLVRGRGSGLHLGKALTRQAGFQAGPDHPAASAALEGRLLPLVCTDIDLVAASRLRPENGELLYLAGWADILAGIGLRLPAQQLEAVCRYVSKHPKQLQARERSDLEKAFRTWGYQPGLVLLGQLKKSN